jgi:hypothetical protein
MQGRAEFGGGFGNRLRAIGHFEHNGLPCFLHSLAIGALGSLTLLYTEVMSSRW